MVELMLTPHGLYEEQLPRIPATLSRLALAIWKVESESQPIHAAPPTREMLSYEQALGQPLDRIESLPMHWGKMFDQRWMRVDLNRPSAHGDWLEWRGQGETTMHSGGIPFGGTDMSRKHVRLPEGIATIWVECLAENIGIWTPAGEDIDPQGCRLDGAYLCERHEAAWTAHTDMAVLYDILLLELRRARSAYELQKVPWGMRDQLNAVPPVVKYLIAHLSKAVDAFEHHGPAAMLPILETIRADLRGGDRLFEAVLTGHAHIDLVWRWPRRVGEFKAVHTFANAVGLLDRYPDFVFGYSQPASYQAVRTRSPQLYSKVEAHIASQRWEPCGMTYVESDTQIPCGEALARSFLIGQRHYQSLTGRLSPVLWLPDAFGFSHVLPQLITEAGGHGFFTTKIHWSSTNRFPHSAFRWRGANGSEVVGFVPGTFDYNGEATASRVYDASLQQRQSVEFPLTLLPTGIGDGGGGPTEEMCRRAYILADMAGMPRTRWGRIDEFYQRLSNSRDSLPVWNGEMYLEYHRGVQTTGHEVKRAYRLAERALQAWEAAAVLCGCGPIEHSAWERLVFAQFHDDLPGTSCGEVYAEHIPELRELRSTSCAQAESLLNSGTAKAYFNPLPLPVRVHHDSGVQDVPALSVAQHDPDSPSAYSCSADEASMVSDRVHVEFDARGLITRFVVDGIAVRIAAPMGGVVAFADRPHAFEAWDIDRASLERSLPAQRDAVIRVGCSKGSVVSVTVETTISRRSRVATTYTLIAGEPVLRIQYDLDLQEQDTLLKAVFPTDYRGSMARYGSPFGSVLRGQRQGSRVHEASFECPASRWMWVCDDGEQNGMSLMTESKYGFGAQDGLMHVSLVRSALVTPWGLQASLRREDAGPDHFDLGKTSVNMAIGLAGTGLPRLQQPAALAETLFSEPIVVFCDRPMPSPIQAIAGSDHVIPVWVKPAENADSENRSCVLRLHEVVGRPGAVQVQLAPGWQGVRVDLLENPIGPVETRPNIEVSPGAFASLRIFRA